MLVSSFFRTHEFIGCSLLLIADRNGKCGVSLIDLAKTNLTAAPLDHRSPWELGNHEDGLLLGVENMIRAWTAVRRLLTLSRSKSNAAQLQLLVGGGVPSAGHKGSGAKSGGVVGHAAASSSTTVLTGTPRSSAVAESIKSILFASSSCKTTAERMRMPMPVAPQNTTNVDHGAPHSSYGSGEGGDEDDGERRETRPSRRRTFAHFRERMRSTVVFGRFSLPPAITWASDALSPVFVPSEKSAIQRMLSAQTRRVGKKRTPPPPESEEDANVDKTLDEQEAQDATCCGMCRRR
ncbi:unnamed protein product [Amoebophrya sp. A25]|nr:unnamed protein product [Amoebophrya sp. A25]|eukprot:GSA25T00009556001.1